MKKINLKIVSAIGGYLLITSAFCQNWRVGGNTTAQLGGSPPIIGTLGNVSIYHYTNNAFKMKLNGDYDYPVNFFPSVVNGAPSTRDGFLLIGKEQPAGGFIPNYFQNKGAFTRLHLHDDASTGGSYDVESGYRPWMRNGVYFSGFSDAGYLGQKANAFDRTDMVFTWSDNAGADNMAFVFTRFHGLAPNTTLQSSGDLVGDGMNGREIMRFASNGMIGMGPRFDAANPPANDLHIRSENLTSSFLQIDNQEVAVNGPTATSGFNGALFGMLGNATATMNGNVFLYNQENRHLFLGTNFGVDPVNTTPSTAHEKVRITCVGAPTDLVPSGYGINNPFGRPLTDTYVAISGDPNNPIKRPTSLLQLGDDLEVGTGVRPWMYTGTMVARQTDHLFVGLKEEGADRFDAVISWGDNDLANPAVGPDNLRFIFTETTVSGPNPPATDLNGVEVGRFVPSCATCPVTKPSMGIGNFSPGSGQSYGSLDYIGATLDIDGDLRIRTVTPNTVLNQVLVIDPLDKNRVHYRDITNLYNSNNGIYNNNNLFQWGVSCSDPNFATNVSAYGVATDRSIQLTADFHFFDPSAGAGRIGIGSTAATNCTTLPNRLVIEALGPNQSGVRLVDLTSSSPTTPNTGQVLSVNASGDVILVDGGAANNGLYSNNGVFQLGVDCNNPNFSMVYPASGFSDDRTVSLVGNNLIFDGNGGGRVGIGMGPCGAVNNRVEITGLAPLQSGLRFTNLLYNMAPSISPPIGTTGKYLTVDVNGDVIMMDGAGGLANNGLSINVGNVQLGQNCGAAGNPGQLLSDREIPMMDRNVYFVGQSNTGRNAIGIGYAGGCPVIPAKLSVRETGNGNSPIAIQGVAIGASTAANTVAGDFFAQNGSQMVFGVRSVAIGSPNTIGGQFDAISTGTSINTYGVRGNANGGNVAIGLYGTASGGSVRSWAGFFQGDVNVNGTYYNNNLVFTSDPIFKTDIDTINNASNIISQLTPRTFFFDTTNVYGMNFSNQRQYGFLTTEVSPVLPELVSSAYKPEVLDSMGTIINPSLNYDVLNYNAMIALLTKGMQEQQTIIQNLINQVNDLSAAVSNCCSQGNSLAPNSNGNNSSTTNNFNVVHSTDVRLADNYCVLGENSPNPFRDHTVINFNLAQSIQSAQIVFYNMLGGVIKVLEINDRGEGRLNVYGEDLRSGMYTYSLIIDGNVCETKKMIKE